MKTRKLIALSAFVGLSSLSLVGAAQQDEAVEVLTSYKQVLAGREGIDAAILERISGLIAEETTDPGALTDTLRELHPDFAKALEAATETGNDEGIKQLQKLTESDSPYLAAESAYYLGRTLMSRQRMEDALPVFINLQDDHFDYSLRIGEAIYYQGICEANTLQRDAASISLNDFIDLYPDAPERLLAEAKDLISTIENVLDGSIEDVADHMDFSTNKLELVDAGEQTQEIQDDIIAMLDELIKQAEDSPP
ncbi:MAG: tetratricopeptide (TPR) repeat protein [Pseudoalteromonas tetraodonis]|jgi:tetratricopeptide (TPR) repeat protein